MKREERIKLSRRILCSRLQVPKSTSSSQTMELLSLECAWHSLLDMYQQLNRPPSLTYSLSTASENQGEASSASWRKPWESRIDFS